jgi:hypothetical protein
MIYAMMIVYLVCMFDISMTLKQLCEQYQYLPKVTQNLPNLRNNDLDQEKKTWALFVLLFVYLLFPSSYKLYHQRILKHLFYTLLDKFRFMFLQSSPVFRFQASCEILLSIFSRASTTVMSINHLPSIHAPSLIALL